MRMGKSLVGFKAKLVSLIHADAQERLDSPKPARSSLDPKRTVMCRGGLRRCEMIEYLRKPGIAGR